MTYQQQLYADLMNLLITNPGSFNFIDEISSADDGTYRVFNYDIPKHSEFKQPGAMDCRGVMFYMDGAEPVLVALPMKKFFSLGETPETLKVTPEQADFVYLKPDGSLLTAYISPKNDKLYYKSKKKPTYAGYHLVEQAISPELNAEIERLVRSGVSVDLELTTPENRVFIEYGDYTVHVLKARDMSTGQYVDIRSDSFAAQYPVIAAHLVKRIPINEVNVNDPAIEGYVIEIGDELYKVKTIPYLKMSAVINIQDRSKERQFIYEATLHEILDEIRSLYHYRTHSPNFPLAEILTRLDEVEDYARKSYRYLVKTVDSFYEENKSLERGDYARKAKEQAPFLVHVLMAKFLQRPVDYKEAAIAIFARKEIPIPE